MMEKYSSSPTVGGVQVVPQLLDTLNRYTCLQIQFLAPGP